MSEYILDVKSQTSKVDWAFPFQRTGSFPLDRSSVFSSFADAEKYALGTGTDERQLGGSAYVGQIVSVYETGEIPTVSAYIIGPTRTLLKLAATTSTGDISQDILRLEQLIGAKASTEYVNQELGKKANANEVYTKTQVETYVAQQIANVDHLKRIVVDELPSISQANTNTIYMVKKTGGIASWGKNVYEEYMVIEGEWELLGNSQVDLSGYEKTEDVDNKLKDKADKATTLEGYGITDAYTKGETYSRTEISELIGQITGGESAADVLAQLNEYKGQNDERVGKVEGRVENLEKAGYQANIIEGIKLADAANTLTLTNKIATIPAAGTSQYGLVKLSNEVGVNSSGELEVKSLDSSKLIQKKEDWLILDGGTSEIE